MLHCLAARSYFTGSIFNMSADPLNQIPELDFHERKRSKPGKLYGILSLLCGLQPFFGILLGLIVNPLKTPFSAVLLLISPFCAFFGLGFGMLGLNTQGRSYAHMGLLLSLLYCLLLLAILYVILKNIFLIGPGASSPILRC